jgi:HTH-type transcriptional regulator / antitoxin HipB
MDIQIAFAEQLSAHLRALRRARGITQTQLGRHFGLSQARIADIEANPAVVSTEQILTILQFLGAEMLVRVPANLAATSARPVHAASRSSPPAATAMIDPLSVAGLLGNEADAPQGAW